MLVVVLEDVVLLLLGNAAEWIVGFFRRRLDGRFEAFDEESRRVCRAVGRVVPERVGAGVRWLRLLLPLSLGGRPPRRAALQHDALRFARDGFGVAGAFGELLEGLLLAFLALPPFVVFLPSSGFAPLSGLFFLRGRPCFEGGGFLRLQAGVSRDGVGVLRGVGGQLGFSGGDVNVVEEVED